MAATERIHWMLATPGALYLFTDPLIPISLFDPLSIMPDLSQSSVRKLLRWAFKLSTYLHPCVQIKISDNVCADLVALWSAPNAIRRLTCIPEPLSSSKSDLE